MPHAFTLDGLMKCWLYFVESFLAKWLAVPDRTVALSDLSPYSPCCLRRGLDHPIEE